MSDEIPLSAGDDFVGEVLGDVFGTCTGSRRSKYGRCAKCGDDDIHQSFHTGNYGDRSCAWDSLTKTEGEHLHYYCRGCGYDWTGNVRQL